MVALLRWNSNLNLNFNFEMYALFFWYLIVRFVEVSYGINL